MVEKNEQVKAKEEEKDEDDYVPKRVPNVKPFHFKNYDGETINLVFKKPHLKEAQEIRDVLINVGNGGGSINNTEYYNQLMKKVIVSPVITKHGPKEVNWKFFDDNGQIDNVMSAAGKFVDSMFL